MLLTWLPQELSRLSLLVCPGAEVWAFGPDPPDDADSHNRSFRATSTALFATTSSSSIVVDIFLLIALTIGSFTTDPELASFSDPLYEEAELSLTALDMLVLEEALKIPILFFPCSILLVDAGGLVGVDTLLLPKKKDVIEFLFCFCSFCAGADLFTIVRRLGSSCVLLLDLLDMRLNYSAETRQVDTMLECNCIHKQVCSINICVLYCVL